MNCPFCKKPTEDFPRKMLRYEISGWAKERTQGGTHAVELQRRTGKVAHAHCVDREKRGLRDQQTFEEVAG